MAGVAGTAVVVYGCLVHPRLMRWGASDEEVARPYPGADLVPDGARGAMAVTIDAPPNQVWPWLVQMGGDRGGGTPGTTSKTPVVQVPKSTRSGRTSPSATT
jgi:hypothetical protein